MPVAPTRTCSLSRHAVALCRDACPARHRRRRRWRRARRHRPAHRRRAGRRRRHRAQDRQPGQRAAAATACTSTSRATTAWCCSPARCPTRVPGKRRGHREDHREGALGARTSRSWRPITGSSARTNDTYITSKVKTRFIEANTFPAQRSQGRHRARRRVPDGHRHAVREGDAAGEIAATTTRACARVVKVFEYRAEPGSAPTRCGHVTLAPPRDHASSSPPATDALARIARAAPAAGDHQRRVRHPASRPRHLSRGRARRLAQRWWWR